jgi:hypothetical protein
VVQPVTQLTHDEYDLLERAVTLGRRIAVHRRGTEYVVVPLAILMKGSREVIEARNPTTGDSLSLYVDELDAVETVGT